MKQSEHWPALPLAEWKDTYATLHMWTQIVGKVRLAFCPNVNHWWGTALYVTARGLTTSAMPYEKGVFEMYWTQLPYCPFLHRYVLLRVFYFRCRPAALSSVTEESACL
jgi:Family of unknown function (DUF5996)